ncbi:MAG: saccharopine dehydrogenase NADP-binding domain-containing protein [candidate division Zixibacteria bacterium]|nr:saccharopine dehydrogenase NADP-binding domain-containing protein [candidate division Zixibacteria bacterium]
MKIVMVGAGLVGGAIAKDLARDKNLEITAADIDQAKLDRLEHESKIKRIKTNLSDSSTVSKLVEDYDLVIGALPGHMGFSTLKTVIEAGKNIVDISFFPEDGFELDQLAKEKKVTAVIDCGVAPGCSNLILGYLTSILEETDSFECYVGGLPRVRNWPYEYKASFSPSDVIEEYTRPARLVEDGEVIIKSALSDVELLDFPGVGTLEAFNTDGLRTLIQTMSAGSPNLDPADKFGNVPSMKEKTMRFPGHAERMRMFRETGFFKKEPISVNGVSVQPLDLTSKLLFPMWKLKEGEEDFTVMRIIVAGKKDGKRKRFTFDLLDNYNKKTKTTSMARTTGYTCSTVVRLLANKKFDRVGICPPEFIGQDHECYQLIMKGLKEKNIVFKETVTELN